MGYVIAIAGKGGVGKTTVTALIINILKKKKMGSVLAVDADPSSNLSEVLGINSNQSIGQILDELSAHPEQIPSGMPKDSFIEYQVQNAIHEDDGFDLLAMGRPEGPGCYCYVNNVLRNVMSKLINDYDYVVIDNEAGLEHLSRRTTRSADVLLVISDATIVALQAAKKIGNLVNELKIKIKKKVILVNRYDKDVGIEKITETGLEYVGNIPQDKGLVSLSLNGNSLLDLKDDAVSLVALRNIGDKIWQVN